MRQILRTTALLLAATAAFSGGAQVRVETLATGFDASGDVSVGPQGNIYVGNYGSTLNDSTGSTVTRITLDGQISIFATGFSGASGNVFDAQGNLYQSSIRTAQVIRVAPDGGTEVYASGISGGVIGLAFDSQGNLYANSCGENRIYRITPDRQVSVFASGPPLSCPNGLTSDPDDNLYAVNFDNGVISRIDTQGNVSLLARTPGGSFRSGGGHGHVTFGNGVIYTVSNASGQVYEVSLDGTTRLLAGSGARGHADGDPATASFQMPNGIDLSADGRRLYINESESLSGTGLTGTYPLTPNRLRVVVLSEGQAINPGMSGGWFDSDNPGQGFLFDVVPSTQTFFAAWFTFRGDPPGKDMGKGMGNDHRWYTLQGSYAESAADLQIFSTTGGLFDEASETATVTVGSATLTFDSCEQARLSYQLDSPARSGTIALSPLVSPTLCLDQAGIPVSR
ncbi:MAG: hypothetical protein QNJ40_14455 [Xanthomonadales bacterium]|nr:hypothetical protein [Xanthomonadales bacterium]